MTRGAEGSSHDTAAISASATVAGFTAVSRFSGLLRVAVIAAVLGATHFGNLFQAANLLPNILFEFLTGPLIASLLIPAVVTYVDRARSGDVERIAGGFLGMVLLVFGLFSVLVIALGPLVLRVLAVGAGDAVGAQTTRVGWLLLALVIPQVMLYAVVGVCVAVQNVHGSFAWPAAVPLTENLGLILTLGGYALVFGTRTELADVGTGHILLLGLGATAAVATHAAVQLWGVRRVGIRLRPRAGWRDAEVRTVARLAVPSLGYASLNAARQFAALVVGSSVPGGVVAFQLAMNFYNLPVALGGRPVAQVSLPRFARAVSDDDTPRIGPRFRTVLGQALSLSLFVILPAGLLLVLFGPDIAQLVSYGAMRTTGGTALLAAALVGIGLGVIGETLFILGTQASYARRNARGPLTVSVVRAGVTVSCMVAVLVVGGAPTERLFLMGVAVAVGDLIAAALMWVLLRRSAEGWFGARRDLLATLVASLALVALATGLILAFGRAQAPTQAALQLMLAGGLAAGGYLVVLRLLGSHQLAAVLAAVRARRAA